MKRIILFAGLISLIAAGCNSATQNNNQNKESESQAFKYQNSYVTGYEGDFYDVNYSFEYPVDQFMAVDDSNSKAKVQLKQKDNNNTHALAIFYNAAAGMTDSAQYFKEVVKCADCTASSKTFDLPSDAKDVKVYENSSSYYIVYAHDPGFVSWQVMKPADEMEKVISSLKVEVSKSNQNPMN